MHRAHGAERTPLRAEQVDWPRRDSFHLNANCPLNGCSKGRPTPDWRLHTQLFGLPFMHLLTRADWALSLVAELKALSASLGERAMLAYVNGQSRSICGKRKRERERKKKDASFN